MDKHSTAVRVFTSANDPHLTSLREANEIFQSIDLFNDCLDELFDIEYPWLKPGNEVYDRTKDRFIASWKKKGPFTDQGNWVYYPWSKTLIHFPPEEVYIRLRTSRNRNLVTEREQAVLHEKCIAVAGMSVGSNILNTLVLTGVGRHFKIADLDIVSVPNLNRIMAPAAAVGMNKAVYFARRALEVDPYLTVEPYTNGLSVDQFDSFFGDRKPDLFIEEMDNPYLKIESRKRAKQLRIPVIMAADNGDGALIDVERFDLEPDRPLFHDRFKNIMDLDSISEKLTFSEKLTIIANMVHLEEATPRAQNSLEEVGTVLNTWPQLGTAALMAGVSLTFVARQILLGESMPSGRYAIGMEEHLVLDYNSSASQNSRRRHTNKIMSNFSAFQQFIDEVTEL